MFCYDNKIDNNFSSFVVPPFTLSVENKIENK